MELEPETGVTSTPCRCYVLLARSAPVGVVLRRGPTDWVQLIRWSTNDDAFEAGQWFRGRIYERRCDISPDGTKLIYFASKLNRRTVADREYTYAWTAISKPPYFTALALWPKGDCWHGGGLFEDDRTVWLNHHPRAAEPHPAHRPAGLTVVPNPAAHGEDGPVLDRRRERDGWVRTRQGRYPFAGRGWRTERTEVWEKTNRAAGATLVAELAEIDFSRAGGPYVETFSLARHGGTTDIGEADWADWDHRGRLVVSRAGKLLEVDPRGDEPRARELADFNASRPRHVKAPAWARTW